MSTYLHKPSTSYINNKSTLNSQHPNSSNKGKNTHRYSYLRKAEIENTLIKSIISDCRITKLKHIHSFNMLIFCKIKYIYSWWLVICYFGPIGTCKKQKDLFFLNSYLIFLGK